LKFFLRKFRFYLKGKRRVSYIETDEDLSLLKLSLEKENILGIDTEFDWRTTYFPKLSLLQIVTNKDVFLIDCLLDIDLSVLKQYMEDENKLIIFHAARSDATVLNTNLNIHIKNSYDIQIAEKFLRGGDLKNYGSIVNDYFSINLDKSETNSNWLKRPLSKSQLNYAVQDVLFLIEIFKIQKKELIKNEKYNLVIKASELETNLGNQSLKSLRVKKLKQKLSRRRREIFLWREEVAELENVPPNYIFKDKHLKMLADLNPADNEAKVKIMKIIGNTDLTNLFIKNFL
tara:strand:- start:263 stop:1126 length:864 start_codon:yes stop_codon:yes gene_type:complete